RHRPQRQRMDRAAHQVAQRGVDHAVARQGQLAGEGRADYGRLEMHAVRAADRRLRAWEAAFDESLDRSGVHGRVGKWRAAGTFECAPAAWQRAPHHLVLGLTHKASYNMNSTA